MTDLDRSPPSRTPHPASAKCEVRSAKCEECSHFPPSLSLRYPFAIPSLPLRYPFATPSLSLRYPFATPSLSLRYCGPHLAHHVRREHGPEKHCPNRCPRCYLRVPRIIDVMKVTAKDQNVPQQPSGRQELHAKRNIKIPRRGCKLQLQVNIMHGGR